MIDREARTHRVKLSGTLFVVVFIIVLVLSHSGARGIASRSNLLLHRHFALPLLLFVGLT